jgi:putative flippase GtrA
VRTPLRTPLLTAARRELLVSALRYGLAGVLNTLVGLGVILTLQFALRLPANLANAIGYAVGVLVSFASSRLFVFRARRARPRAPLRYALAVALAFTVNQAVLTLARLVVPHGAAWQTLAQVAAVGSYTVVLFLLSHYWVFAHHAEPEPDAAWNA